MVEQTFTRNGGGDTPVPGGRTLTRRDGWDYPPADKSVGATSVQAMRFSLPPSVLLLLYKLLLPDTTVAFLAIHGSHPFSRKCGPSAIQSSRASAL